jgi:glutaredoxin
MKKAILYRMVTDEHICPFGIKSLDLLKRKGFKVEDKPLKTRQEADEFKEKHKVKTTPQTFIDEKRIGGYDDLLKFFGKEIKDKDKKTYTPIYAVFAVTFGLALAVGWLMNKEIVPIQILELFVAISMSVLAILKLRDLDSFTNQFITYDLLGGKVVRYAYVYPFIEAIAGISMVAKVGLIIVSPFAFIIGTIGAISVIKAVYIDKRDLKCACVGGDSNVPLGFISLTENLMMMFMGVWMIKDYLI